MSPRNEEIAQYAEAVRGALADVPDDDRAELLEDLEDHLAEVAEESEEPLTARLGTPEEYAAELRAAYGAGADKAGRRSPRALVADLYDHAEGWFRQKVNSSGASRTVWTYVQELRPAWWLLRGFLAAVLVWYFLLGRSWHVWPWGVTEWVILVTFLLVSLVLGVRSRDQGRGGGTLRALVICGNALAVIALLALPSVAGITYLPSSSVEQVPVPTSDGSGLIGDGVTNIYPYSKDGKPLRDILLYDQQGRPVQVAYQDGGMELVRCDGPPPMANSYPLPLQSPTGEPEYSDSGEPITPTPSPSCSSASPSAAPHPSGSPTGSGSPSPSKSPSPSPSPTPTD